VELLLALTMVAVLAAVALPSFRGFSTPFQVQSVGREVYAALQETRQQAVMRGRRTRFELTTPTSYKLLWDNGGVWTTIRGPIALDPGVQAASSGGALTFQPRGTVTPLSTITISSIQDPQHRMVITIPITGLVRIREGGG
jgi:Tfp pilus assembly protein FimT